MMAESMIVYFGTATSGEVAAWLDRHLSGSNGSWCFPSTGDYLVLVYEFEHCLASALLAHFAGVVENISGERYWPLADLRAGMDEII